MLPTVVLLGMSLTLIAGRCYHPWAARPPGSVVIRIPVPFGAKVRMQRTNVYALAALLLLGSVGGWIAPLLELAMIATTMGLLLLPVHYTLTDHAIALGRTPFRKWTEFTRAETRRGLVTLRGRDGADGLPIWLPVTSDRDPHLELMNRLIEHRKGA